MLLLSACSAARPLPRLYSTFAFAHLPCTRLCGALILRIPCTAKPSKLKAALFGQAPDAAFVRAGLWNQTWLMDLLWNQVKTVNVDTWMLSVLPDWQRVRLRHLRSVPGKVSMQHCTAIDSAADDPAWQVPHGVSWAWLALNRRALFGSSNAL